MKILLIIPNINSYDHMPCLSVATLKAFINEKTKHEVKIIDLVYHKNDWSKYIIERIRDEKPDLIGFSILSFNYSDALRIAQFIKDNFDIKIIFGGVHVILSPQEVIENEVVDIICTGEGEEVLKELLDRSLKCKDVKGIWYKSNDKIIKNKNRRLNEKLDDISFPDFEDFDIEKYFVINHNHYPIMASRGCPYSCTFCGNHALKKNLVGSYVRFRSARSVIEEIELRINQYQKRGLKFLYFFDDTFVLYQDFVEDFCKKYKEKGFHKDIKWSANVRANLVTDDLIETMKSAGCYEVRMGVESGNDYIRNTIYKRNMSKEQLINAFKIIKKHGLQLRLDFIIGAPYETIEMMEESLDLAKKSKGDRIFFTKLYPFPGTKIREICEKERIIEPDTHHNSGEFHSVNKTKFVSENQFHKFTQKVSWWQTKRYIKEGIKMKGLFFLYDVIVFLLYNKSRYDMESNQIFRWNVQNYKLSIM